MRLRVTVNDTLNGIVHCMANPNEMSSERAQEIYRKMTILCADLENMRSGFRDCVNELCIKCGCYKRSHEGACDDCRWKAVKEGFR